MSSCDCGDSCNNQYGGHTCTLESGHSGSHSCHGRIFRQTPRRGDFVWQDGRKCSYCNGTGDGDHED